MPGGTAAKAVDRALAWGTPLVSEHTLMELSEVLSRDKFDGYVVREDRKNFLRLLGGIVRVVPIIQQVTVCRETKDDKFLDLALNGEAQLLLTGDQDLLVLHPFHGIDIISPTDFLQWPAD